MIEPASHRTYYNCQVDLQWTLPDVTSAGQCLYDQIYDLSKFLKVS